MTSSCAPYYIYFDTELFKGENSVSVKASCKGDKAAAPRCPTANDMEVNLYG